MANEYSFANMLLYGAVIPGYDDQRDDTPTSERSSGKMNFGEFMKRVKKQKEKE